MGGSGGVWAGFFFRICPASASKAELDDRCRVGPFGASRRASRRIIQAMVSEGLDPPRPARHDCDVLVVGGGPGGSAAAYWLASQGVDVLCVEKKHFPREKTCGDGLTPRSVRQLREMGLEGALAGHHRYDGLRSMAFHRELEMAWPSHPDYPSYGYTITRFDLDELVSEHAEKAGAVVWQGAEAVAPLALEHASDSRRGPAGALTRCGGAVVVDRAQGTRTDVHARYVIVADGALSRFGRLLGTSRDKSYPQGMAIRGYFYSPRHADRFIESHLDIRDRNGNVVPGYGWIFPLGDGRVNVGIGLLSTAERWKGLNTTRLMQEFVDFAPKSWCISPSTACSEPTGGRLPMGFSMAPRSGEDFVVVGDASGDINPFNGEGIAYAWETGRIAAEVVAAALSGETGRGGATGSVPTTGAGVGALYEQRLQEGYGRYYAIARGFVKAISDPRLMRATVGAGMLVPPVMRGVLRIMANLNRPDQIGGAEGLYRGLVQLSESVEKRRSRPGARPVQSRSVPPSGTGTTARPDPAGAGALPD
jgi:geranylgeranyl reductase family protein